jgi:hypothetical protein
MIAMLSLIRMFGPRGKPQAATSSPDTLLRLPECP